MPKSKLHFLSRNVVLADVLHHFSEDLVRCNLIIAKTFPTSEQPVKTYY